MTQTLTRRQILRWGLVGGAALTLPASLVGCGDDDQLGGLPTPSPLPTTTPTAVPRFLSADERRVVQAITGRVIPTDDLPGALEADAVEYIDRLLSFVPDVDSPGNVYGGGPFSNRNPFPDPTTGAPSTNFPANSFPQFLPLTRLQLLSWRVHLLGSANVPGGDFNDATLGPVTGIRDQYRTGIAALQAESMQMFGGAFDTLTPPQQDAVLAASDAGFVGLITDHTLEGMFSAPEYGGNRNLVGWTLIQYDGDSQPLGYAIFDETTMSYNERSDKPTSMANPNEDFAGVDSTTQRFLRALVRVANPGTPHFP